MNKWSKSRNQWVNDSREEFLQIAADYQDALIKAIKEGYLPKINTKDGKIIFDAKNMATIGKLDTELKKIAALKGDKLLEWFLEQTQKNGQQNKSYFSEIVGKKGIEKAYNIAMESILLRLGYDGSKFIENGLLFDLSRVNDPIRKIKAETIKAISQGQSFFEFQKSISGFVTGGQNAGIIENHFRTNAYDTFQQIDRAIGNNMAVSLELNFAMYSEGLMTTSRKFCRDRVGKVFSRKEIEGWRKLDWDGKNENYDPLTDVGGYNCTHTLDWITDDLAKILKPDNVVDEIVDLNTKPPIIKFESAQRFDDYINNENVPDLIKNVVNKLPKPREIKVKGTKKGSYYNPYNNTLVSTLEGKERTFFHEYGHHVDMHMAKNNSINETKQGVNIRSSKMKDDFDKDVKNINEKYGANALGKIKEYLKSKSDFKDGSYNGFSDIIDAMSNGIFYNKYHMPGHGQKYYKQDPMNKYLETYAQIFEAIARNDKKIIKDFQDNFPNSFNFVLNDLKSILND